MKLKWLVILAIVAFGANTFYQIYRFPLQAMRLIPITGPKTLAQTWRSYRDDFIQYSTKTLPPRFLAALAHAESLGDAWAVPPWQWQASIDPMRWFAPMSSAFGLMQLTSPTTRQAIRLCDIGATKTEAHQEFCQSSFGTRLLPSSSIALTSLLLDHQVHRLFRRHHTPGRSDQLKLAAVVHLCGEGGGNRLYRKGFNISRMGFCGSHRVSNYVGRVTRNFNLLKSDY